MRHATILIALAAATPAHAGGDRTLHLALHGSVDSAAVGAALARELGVTVAVVEGACDVPCLDVAVDGKTTATITFSPRTGAPRTRTVTLGTDTTQWPLVITLLAGNVVRDEAQDVLADLPARDLPKPAEAEALAEVPPAPADEPPPADPVSARAAPAVAVTTLLPPSGPVTHPEVLPPPAEPEPVREQRWLGLGFVPGLSTDLAQVGSVGHHLSIDLLVGVSGGSTGLTLSGIADIERGPVSGFQVGGVLAVARRLSGTQVAGVAAVAGDVTGVQVAGAAAVADRIDGFQIGGVAVVSRAAADTQIGGVAAFARGRAATQIGGVATVAGGDAGLQIAGVTGLARDAGVQVAGVASVAHGNAGVQVGGVAAVAAGTVNTQIAGVVNVAHRVRGLQLATVNIAHEVEGVQVGVVNVGGSADGFSFGLINIVPGGRYDLETSVDSSKTGTVLFRHGGRRWHNVYGIGGHPVKETGPSDDVWMYGLGFGPSYELRDTVVDLELIGWQVNHGPRHESDVSVLGQLRLSVAHHWGPFAIVAGGVLNTYVTNDAQSPLMLERRSSGSPMSSGVTVTTWPSAFIGVRI